MKQCQNCGHLNPDDFKFCQNCGKSLEASVTTPAQKNCPFCGTSLESSAKFCRKCGAAQDLSEQVQPDILLDVQAMNSAGENQGSTTETRQPGQETRQTAQMQQEMFYPQSQPKKSHTALIVVLVCLAVFVAAGGGGLFYMYQNEMGFFADSDEDDVKTIKKGKIEDRDSDSDEDEKESRTKSTATPRPTPSRRPTSTPRPTPTVTPTPTPQPTTEAALQAGQYVLPDSSTRYLTMTDLAGLTAEQCRIARNEIYARHGRMFDDANLQAYFNACPWYQGTIPAASFNDDMLSTIEKANRDLIVQYEKEQGYR